MSDEKLLRLRVLMAAHGYEEVRCETFRTDNPTGPYSQLPEGEPPHWCTSVEFQKAS